MAVEIVANPTGRYIERNALLSDGRRAKYMWEMIAAWERNGTWFGYYFPISLKRYRENWLKWEISSRLKYAPVRPRLPE